MGKRRKLFLIAGTVFVVLALVGGGVSYYIWYRTGRVDDENKKTLARSLAKGIEEDKADIFNTPELKRVSDAFYAKNYEEVVSISPSICANTFSMSRYSCYGVYGQSLVALKRYDKLSSVAATLLTEQQVKDNLTLTKTWILLKEAGEKKVDPKTLQTQSVDEALK